MRETCTIDHTGTVPGMTKCANKCDKQKIEIEKEMNELQGVLKELERVKQIQTALHQIHEEKII